MHPDLLAALEEFCKRMLAEYDGKVKDGLIKAIWVYGSAVKGEARPTSDVDVLVLLDDVTRDIPRPQLKAIEGYMDEIVMDIRKRRKISLHPQPPKRLSDWWDLLRGGEPWVFTSMRDAVPIYDPSGYIEPIQRLLRGGRLHGTWERAQALIQRAPYRLELIRRVFIDDITADLLAAMTESAQATLMFAGVAPPAPAAIPIELRKNFVKVGLLEEIWAEMYEDFYELTRKLEHGELKTITGKEISKWLSRVKKFILRFEQLFKVLEDRKKAQLVQGAHRKAIRACQKTLRALGKPVKEGPQILKYVEQHLIKPGLVSKAYLDVLRKIFAMHDALEAGRLAELPERDVYSSELYAKRLALALEEIRPRKRK